MPTSDIKFQLRVSRRAKYMRLTVHAVDHVVVTVPVGLGMDAARDFLASRAEWLARAIERVRHRPVRQVLGTGKREYRALKEQARAIISERAKFFANQLGVSFGRISIRNQKSCWGSCSLKKNLNFNYRLIHLDPNIRDYIIAHEVAHLTEFNHSSRFWAQVSRICPEYKERRKALRKYAIR